MTFLKLFIQLLLLVAFGIANQAATIAVSHPLSNGRTVDIPEDMAERFQQLYTIMQTESAFADHKVKFLINGFEYTAVLLGSTEDPETGKKIHHVSFDPLDVRFVEGESSDEGFYIAVVSPEGEVEFEENFEVRNKEGVSKPGTNGSGRQNNAGTNSQSGAGGSSTAKGNSPLGSAHEAGKSGGASAAGAKGVQLLLVPPSMLKEILGLKKEIEFQSKLYEKREKEFEEARKKEINEMVAVSIPALLQLANMQEVSIGDVEFEDSEKFQFKSADPEFLATLQELNETLSSHQPRSQEEYLVKDIGLAAVQMADHSASVDQSVEAEAYKEIAITAADVLVGIDPFTGIARDFTEFYSGKNMITGQSLSSTERILSGVFFVAGLGTGGLANSAKGITKAAVTLGRKVLGGGKYKGLFKNFGEFTKRQMDLVEVATSSVDLSNGSLIQKKLAQDYTELFESMGLNNKKDMERLVNIVQQVPGSRSEVPAFVAKMLNKSSSVNPSRGNEFVKQLPDLKGSHKDAFDGHIFKGEYEPGEIVFQAQRTDQIGQGNWFSSIKPLDALHAEDLLNIKKWGNDAGQLKAFVVKERVSGYAGKVAGGEGHQFYVPEGTPIDEIFEEIKF
ncbi:MAG: pre-toxin TG domain-containing protein [Bdellovibrionota bacterium]|nr:pre-toxin TG domain-containing protein [Bdellovibrionota bacterium]